MINSKKIQLKPPTRSRNIASDLFQFVFKKAKQETLIRFVSAEERSEYNQRIMQRIGIDSNQYSVLNIHKIGIDAPVSYVFKELLNWDGDSTCWPNHLAKVDRIDDNLGNIRILPLGINRLLGVKMTPLFLLKALRIKQVPDAFDFDNARYLLYECSGGYPIGIYTMYVRSSIAEMGETAQSQLILAVGFNFYGKKDWQNKRRLINAIWESVHNRVTSNVLGRLKQLCEWRIESIQNK